MRRFGICILLTLFAMLTACGVRSKIAGHVPPPPVSTEAETKPPVLLPETTVPTGTEETESVGTEPAMELTAPQETDPTVPPETEPQIGTWGPQAGSPITPQPGDTAAIWDAARAEHYPHDEECSDLELLEKWLAVEGLTLTDVEELGCRQLILTAAQDTDGVETVTVCYEYEDGAWVPVEFLGRMFGWVGKNGIMHARLRNTETSPAGLWALGMAFGNEKKPEGLKLPWRDVTPQSDWVCDAASPYFNTWQERDDPMLECTWDYGDVEHLEDYPISYAYACVIEFNTFPYTMPDRGCAIFLHCATGYTGGCVGLPREDMLAVLRWLDPDQTPYILITGYQLGE